MKHLAARVLVCVVASDHLPDAGEVGGGHVVIAAWNGLRGGRGTEACQQQRQ